MTLDNLKETIQHITKNGKGILAADESTSTAGKRLADIGAENTEENRRDMRELFFTTPDVEKFIGGVILYDETLRQASVGGKLFKDMLIEKGIVPGIKVDLGLEPFGTDGEEVTKGLDDLAERLAEYYDLGARFAKWRAVITITDTLPTSSLIEEASKRLAVYARLCQESGIVPIVEPEVLMDHPTNNTHTLERSFDVTSAVHKALFAALAAEGVSLEGVMLKPSMVIAGSACEKQNTIIEVAEKTVACLKETVPANTGAVVFLSGGQNDLLATEHLNMINKLFAGTNPWPITYSYGRALQAAAIQSWGLKKENWNDAQAVFAKRCLENTKAALGQL